MTSALYQEWIQQWDQELGTKNRKILLLQDNFSGHITPDGLQNIHVENFEPNLTAHIQPIDQCIIRCFKAHYCTKFIQHTIDHYNTGVTPSKIYDTNQLQAMQFADAAWHELDAMTIKNCWWKAGILPSIESPAAAQPTVSISSLLNTDSAHGQGDCISDAEKHIEGALDELELRGALQHSNRMDLKTILNPVDESQVLDEVADEEIFQAVQDSRNAQKEAMMDPNFDNDSSANACPMRHEVLQAVSDINNYVDTLNST